MLTIGEFSRLSPLSARTLRRYHDAGLLEPAFVDDATGYRHDSVDQVPQHTPSTDLLRVGLATRTESSTADPAPDDQHGAGRR